MMPQMIARCGTEGKPTSCAGQVNTWTWKLPFCTVTFERPQAPPPILPPPGSYKYLH